MRISGKVYPYRKRSSQPTRVPPRQAGKDSSQHLQHNMAPLLSCSVQLTRTGRNGRRESMQWRSPEAPFTCLNVSPACKSDSSSELKLAHHRQILNQIEQGCRMCRSIG